VILRKVRPQGKTVKQSTADENPYERIGREIGYVPPMDVEKRLDDMMYMGGSDSSIHLTQVSVSASMLEAGEDVETIVATLMHATRRAAGDYGKRWNWKVEERNIRKMCETWLKKREKNNPKPNSRSDSPDHRERPQSTSGPALAGASYESTSPNIGSTTSLALQQGQTTFRFSPSLSPMAVFYATFPRAIRQGMRRWR